MTSITAVDVAKSMPGWHAANNLLHIPVTHVEDGATSTWHAIVLPADRPPIVCLCGSTRFRDEFARANRDLTNEGHIVLAPGVFGHSGDPMTDEQKQLLDDLHRRKIDLADSVYVVNPGGYVGPSTRSEIDYAAEREKPIRYLEPVAVAAEQDGEVSR